MQNLYRYPTNNHKPVNIAVEVDYHSDRKAYADTKSIITTFLDGWYESDIPLATFSNHLKRHNVPNASIIREILKEKGYSDVDITNAVDPVDSGLGFLSNKPYYSAECILTVRVKPSMIVEKYWVIITNLSNDTDIVDDQRSFDIRLDFIKVYNEQPNLIKPNGSFYSMIRKVNLRDRHFREAGKYFIGDKYEWECHCNSSECDNGCIEEERGENIQAVKNWMDAFFLNVVSKGDCPIELPEYDPVSEHDPIEASDVFEFVKIEVENLPSSSSISINMTEALTDCVITSKPVEANDKEGVEVAKPDYVRLLSSTDRLLPSLPRNGEIVKNVISRFCELNNSHCELVDDYFSSSHSFLNNTEDSLELISTLYSLLGSLEIDNSIEEKGVLLFNRTITESWFDGLLLKGKIKHTGFANYFTIEFDYLNKLPPLIFKVKPKLVDKRNYFTFDVDITNNNDEVIEYKYNIGPYQSDHFFYELFNQKGWNNPEKFITNDEDLNSLMRHVVKYYLDHNYGLGFIQLSDKIPFYRNKVRYGFDLDKIEPYLDKAEIDLVNSTIEATDYLGLNTLYDMETTYSIPIYKDEKVNLYLNLSKTYDDDRKPEHGLKINTISKFIEVSCTLYLTDKDHKVKARYGYSVKLSVPSGNHFAIGTDNYLEIETAKKNPLHVLYTGILCLDILKRSLN